MITSSGDENILVKVARGLVAPKKGILAADESTGTMTKRLDAIRVKLSKKTSRKEKKSNLGKPISKDEAELFLKHYQFPSIKGVSVFSGRNNIVSAGSRKTTPNVIMFGGDENYPDMSLGWGIYCKRMRASASTPSRRWRK